MIQNYEIISNAQQSCVPATALKRKVAKLQFCLSVYLSVLFCLSVYLSISSYSKLNGALLIRKFDFVLCVYSRILLILLGASILGFHFTIFGF